MLTLKGKLVGKTFVNEDGVCYPLEYAFNESDEVYINCKFNENASTLSVYKIFKVK
jgi:hypothetical protein